MQRQIVLMSEWRKQWYFPLTNPHWNIIVDARTRTLSLYCFPRLHLVAQQQSPDTAVVVTSQTCTVWCCPPAAVHSADVRAFIHVQRDFNRRSLHERFHTRDVFFFSSFNERMKSEPACSPLPPSHPAITSWYNSHTHTYTHTHRSSPRDKEIQHPFAKTLF